MNKKSFNLLNIVLLSGVFVSLLLLAVFLWKYYFLISSPIQIEEEAIPSFLDLQSIKEASSLRQELSQLTNSLPSASLKQGTESAQIEGAKTNLSVALLNLSGQKETGLVFKEILESHGFEVKEIVETQIKSKGVWLEYKSTVSPETLFLIEKIFKDKAEFIKKTSNLPQNYSVDIRIFLGR